MTENVNTYVLPEDSNSILAEILPAFNPLRITWEVLSLEEKKEFLIAALRKIEGMTFIGKRTRIGQPLKFPRTKPIGAYMGYSRLLKFGVYNPNLTPVEVKRAQVLWAVNIMRDELYLKKRNNEACLALGIKKSEECSGIEQTIKELLHNWITNWRRI